MNLSEGSKQRIEANINYPDEVQSAGEAIHDQAAAAAAGSLSSKKRGGPPLSEEERKRKSIIQKKSRDKIKADIEKTKVDLKTTKKKVEDLEIEKKSLNEKIESTEQRLKNAATHIEQLKSLIERSNETNSLNQDYVRKLEEELQGLKIEYRKLECENASLKAERDVMTIDLQASAANTEEILSCDLVAKTEQQQFEDFCTNELKHIQELPMEQEQSGQEENERPITTRDIQELKSMLMKFMTQNVQESKSMLMTFLAQISQRMDALETLTLMPIAQISQRISALETQNPPSQAYRVAKEGTKLGASSAML